jgi:hypothetical protein
MTPDQNTDLVRRWIAFAEAGFRGNFDEFIAADCVGHLGECVMHRRSWNCRLPTPDSRLLGFPHGYAALITAASRMPAIRN